MYPTALILLLTIFGCHLHANKGCQENITFTGIHKDDFKKFTSCLKKAMVNSEKLKQFKDDANNNIFHVAALENETDVIKAVIEHYPQVAEALINDRNEDDKTPLHIAIEEEQHNIIQTLLNTEYIDIYKKNKIGDTPVHIAVRSNNAEAIKELLAQDVMNIVENHPETTQALINTGNNIGKTPLHLAVHSKQLHDINQILLKKEYLNVNKPDDNGDTALHIAVRNNNIKAITQLFTRKDINLNPKNDLGDTPLHIAAYNNNAEVITKLLRKKDIKPNEKMKPATHLYI